MPGKYSHSVVLADYSARGVIALPSEQQEAYLKTSPYAASQYGRYASSWSQPPTPQKRSQSAMAYTGPYNPNHHNLTSPLRHAGVNRNAEQLSGNHNRYELQRAMSPDVRVRNGPSNFDSNSLLQCVGRCYGDNRCVFDVRSIHRCRVHVQKSQFANCCFHQNLVHVAA